MSQKETPILGTENRSSFLCLNQIDLLSNGSKIDSTMMLHLFALYFVTKILIMRGIIPVLLPHLAQKYFA